MKQSTIVAEVWRGEFLECVHAGHIAICNAKGDLLAGWGNPKAVVLPRSSCKMIQALPLVESGAADAFGLTPAQLALACSSHQGAALHTGSVSDWLANIGLSEADLRCGGHMPFDLDAQKGLICGDHCFDQTHNNCSGKHSGFLTLNKHLGGGSEYIEIDHPIQKAIKEATEDMADEDVQGHAIDGCSAPNFAISLQGLARSVARMADPVDLPKTRQAAAKRLVAAMAAHPEMVAGETRACTELMRAMKGRVVVKTGADGVFVAIIPELKLGVALKIMDGTTKAAECALAAILVRLGVADANDPLVQKRLNAPNVNCNGITAAHIAPAAELYCDGAPLRL